MQFSFLTLFQEKEIVDFDLSYNFFKKACVLRRGDSIALNASKDWQHFKKSQKQNTRIAIQKKMLVIENTGIEKLIIVQAYIPSLCLVEQTQSNLDDP